MRRESRRYPVSYVTLPPAMSRLLHYWPWHALDLVSSPFNESLREALGLGSLPSKATLTQTNSRCHIFQHNGLRLH
jgi:hypothetical protein